MGGGEREKRGDRQRQTETTCGAKRKRKGNKKDFSLENFNECNTTGRLHRKGRESLT